jgi:hypothetical protein
MMRMGAMGTWTQATDGIRRIRIEPEITRVFWSERRAVHGDELEVHVETRHVPDGATVKFEVLKGANVIATLDDGLAIDGSKCISDHTVEVADDGSGETETELILRAVIEEPKLEGRSAPLIFDLDDSNRWDLFEADPDRDEIEEFEDDLSAARGDDEEEDDGDWDIVEVTDDEDEA